MFTRIPAKHNHTWPNYRALRFGFSTLVNGKFTAFCEGVAAQSRQSVAAAGIFDSVDAPFQFSLFGGADDSARWTRNWLRNVSGYHFDFACHRTPEIAVDLVDQLGRLMLQFQRRAIVGNQRECRAAGARLREAVGEAMSA